MEARRRGEDIIDLGMGNPDLPTPKHIVNKLIEAVKNPRNHRYSASKGIYKLEVCDHRLVPKTLRCRSRSGNRERGHHRRQGRTRTSGFSDPWSWRCCPRSGSDLSHPCLFGRDCRRRSAFSSFDGGRGFLSKVIDGNQTDLASPQDAHRQFSS